MEMTFQDAINLAVQLHREGRLGEAEHLYAQIVRAQPAWGDAHAQFADVLVAMNKAEQAIIALQTAITCNPTNPALCYSNLSVLLHRRGRYSEAAMACRQAIALQPGHPIAHRNLADALIELGEYEAAEQSCRTAILLDSGQGDFYNQLGLSMYHRGRYALALEQFQIALKFDPSSVNACMNAVLCNARLANREATEATLRRTIELSPNEPDLSSGLVMILNYSHGEDPQYMLRESVEYDRRHITPVLPYRRPHQIDRNPNRPLRIGYVSPDFRHHSVSFFLEPLIVHHDRSKFQIACYAELKSPDDKTEVYFNHADLWRNTIELNDQQLAEQIRADQIDILIDLAGHTVSNRLPVFGYKPAPIQMTWLGYPNTTGVSTIDYRITDALADPPGADDFYVEELIRLPDAFFVYQPPAEAPPVAPLPMLATGHVTFGSFNSITKITAVAGQLWSQILQAVPNSKLVVVGALHAERLSELIPDIDPGRIELLDTLKFQPYLDLFGRVDIALDSFPWAGHTTTCHSLWMGVPVVSLAGPTAVSRAGMSVMGNLGMDRDWVAHTEEDYVRKAIEWANRPNDLAAIRAGLREKMQRSPIMDAPRFAKNFEDQLRLLMK
jgi:predicted O-linked N-acetylglucosamine transferase (SPINDLY family)